MSGKHFADPMPHGRKKIVHIVCPTSSPFALQVHTGLEVSNEGGVTLAVSDSRDIALFRSLASTPLPPYRQTPPRLEGLRMSVPVAPANPEGCRGLTARPL